MTPVVASPDAAADGFVRWLHRNRALATCVAAISVASIALHLHLGLVLPEAVYETLRLFLIQVDPQFGERAWALQHGFDHWPTWETHVLWALRFAAPLVSAGAFVQFVRYAGLARRVPVRWRDHVVIAGAGRLGAEICRACRAAGARVVVVERDSDNPHLDELRRLGARVLHGDGTAIAMLRAAGIARAACLVAVMADDVANVTAGTRASVANASRADFRAFVHVADFVLKERLEELLASAHRVHVRLFNTYQLAADELVAHHLREPADAAALHVIAGFGRFGRSVLVRLLENGADHARCDYWIVDPAVDASTVHACCRRVRGYRREALRVLPADMLHPDVWEQIEAAVSPRRPARFFICTDDDVRNLDFALTVLRYRAERGLDIRVLVRMFRWPLPFLEHDHERLRDMEAINLMELIRRRLPEEMQALIATPHR